MNGLSVSVGNILKIGQLVKLVVKTQDEFAEVGGTEESDDLEVRAYGTRIEDLFPESLVVSWPTDQGIRLLATVGQSVSLEIRCQHGVLCLDSRITSLAMTPIPVLQVYRQGDWSRSQLRKNVRLEVTISPSAAALLPIVLEDLTSGNGSDGHVDVGALKKWEASGKPEGEPFRAMIRDLSAGGVLLMSSVRLAKGSIVRVRFPLGRNQPELSTLAVVVREGEGEPGNKEYPFKAGCRFLDLSMRDEDITTRFIFARQAELRRSGML